MINPMPKNLLMFEKYNSSNLKSEENTLRHPSLKMLQEAPVELRFKLTLMYCHLSISALAST